MSKWKNLRPPHPNKPKRFDGKPTSTYRPLPNSQSRLLVSGRLEITEQSDIVNYGYRIETSGKPDYAIAISDDKGIPRLSREKKYVLCDRGMVICGKRPLNRQQVEKLLRRLRGY